MILTPSQPQPPLETTFDGRAERRLPGQNRPQSRRGGGPMKFLRSLRGEGVLVSDAQEVLVTYQLDIFESGFGRTGSGVLEGRLSESFTEGAARLRLADGQEFAVTLQDIDDDGAAFETRAAPQAG